MVRVGWFKVQGDEALVRVGWLEFRVVGFG